MHPADHLMNQITSSISDDSARAPSTGWVKSRYGGMIAGHLRQSALAQQRITIRLESITEAPHLSDLRRLTGTPSDSNGRGILFGCRHAL